MQCVIVAAGQGTRLRRKGDLKPLVELRGMPIVEHVMGRVRAAGIAEFVVVNGWRGEVLCAALDAIAGRLGVVVHHVRSSDWQRANGVSLLSARALLDGPFLLTMCDHLSDPRIYERTMAAVQAGTVTLAVDYDIGNAVHDPDDITRVACADGLITRIGKHLAPYDCIDTGTFACTPAMFAALEESQAGGNDGISGAMTVLARQGLARTLDVTGLPWVDIDDPAAYAAAEAMLDAGVL